MPSALQDGKAAAALPTDDYDYPWLFNPLLRPRKPMTANQKFMVYAHRTFGPPAFVSPAIGAAMRMANPPSDYPRDWKDGGEAFGRLYGSSYATQFSRQTAEYIVGAAFHYDSRYFPSHSKDAFARIAHALAYTVVQKTDSGRTALALPHFAGAAAGGFVGLEVQPPGYNDLSHAERRAATSLLSIGVRNLAFEFAPELAPLERFVHIPRIVPAWWTPEDHPHSGRP
jgi:hypothetical protein